MKDGRMGAHKAGAQREVPDVGHWVDEHADLLFRYALQRVRRRELAEDLVQETFVAALQSRGTFSGRSSERTWLVGILRHKIVDHLRQLARTQPNGQMHEVETTVASQFRRDGHWSRVPSKWGADPAALIENQDFWTVFHKCFGALPEPLASAFALREMEEFESREVCRTLDITESNLWVRLHRARLLLKDCLEDNWFQRSSG